MLSSPANPNIGIGGLTPALPVAMEPPRFYLFPSFRPVLSPRVPAFPPCVSCSYGQRPPLVLPWRLSSFPGPHEIPLEVVAPIELSFSVQLVPHHRSPLPLCLTATTNPRGAVATRQPQPSDRPLVRVPSRTWLFMAERMHEETTEKEENRKRLSDDDGATDDSGSEEGEEGELLGGEEASRSNLGMRAAQKSAMTLSRKAMTTAMSMMSHIATRRKRPKGSPQAGMSRHKPGDLFQTWRKKDAHAEGNPDYLNGRLRIGQTFLEVFAARNLWAVEDFGFGKSPSHAEKMGLALELIVNSATKPKVLQHKLRVLALGHAQMGIKSAMFPRFGEALFEFLDQVQAAALHATCLTSDPPPSPAIFV